MLPHEILWIPLVPFASALVLWIFGKRLSDKAVATIACAAPLISFLAGLACLKALLADPVPLSWSAGSWIAAGDVSIDFAFRVDPLSCVMTLVVAGVGFLIHVFSIGYMHGDPGFKRYFLYLNLFVGSMLTLVTAETLPLLFLGWEGVGVCSYLLIGFWYEDPEKAAAGLKAFLVNKAADVAFLAGMLILAVRFGTLDIPTLAGRVLMESPLENPFLPAAALLLFIAACGKSAQIFLHVWLPDAMAGPTPVSALIHAATMVTAGAYLVARLNFLYPAGLLVTDLVAVTGAVTAAYAAVCALAQTDIKKVLAYSTVSQLGFLFLGLGVGAFPASIFHLATHAFFKAVLFLSAGSVIHALSGEQNICRMGNGLWRKMPVTFACATAAVLSATMFPFAGFVSKHQILHAASEGRPPIGWIATAASVLTAVYLARWWVQVFFARNDSHAASHAHESPATMTVPLVLLAGLALAGGVLNWPGPAGGCLERFLSPIFFFVPLHTDAGDAGALPSSLAIPVAALFLAWIYAKHPGWFDAVRRVARPVREAAAHGFHIDDLYRDFIVTPVTKGSVLLWAFIDLLAIDGLAHAAAGLVSAAGSAVRRLSTGVASTGLAAAIVGATAFLAWAAWGR